MRILLTGISGVGKSTVTDELARRGYKAVDADGDEYSEWVKLSAELAEAPGSPVEAHRDWIWREDRIADLLSAENAEVLFVSGCAANMGKFLARFEHVILLSAPADIVVERLQTRTNNTYGRRPEETARVLSLKQSVEPLLRRAAGHEIDTAADLEAVLSRILRVVGLLRSAAT